MGWEGGHQVFLVSHKGRRETLHSCMEGIEGIGSSRETQGYIMVSTPVSS